VHNPLLNALPQLLFHRTMTLALQLLALLLLSSTVVAQEAALSAAQYVAAMKAAAPKGGCYIRVKMDTVDAGGARQSLQVQIKRRDLGAGKAEHLYQVLSPKERRGEAVLLRISGSKFMGSEFTPGKGLSPLKASDRHDPLLGTSLTVDDLMADFLDWPQQTLAGNEKVGGADCAIIESTQGDARVKSWVDQKRYVALKAEVYSPATQLRRTVHSVTARRTDSGRFAPIEFSVTSAAGVTTEVRGAAFSDDVPYTDADFTDATLQQVTPAPRK
jgi:hypothetical protein